MINPALHRQPVPLDPAQHRKLKLTMPVSPTAFAGLNACFLHGMEFLDACREYPVIFVRAGSDEAGQPLVAPMAALGLAAGENLYLDGGRWDADYVPAQLKTYPFAVAQVDAERVALCIDRGCADLSEDAGAPLFEADGQPAEFVAEMQQLLTQLEGEVVRTQRVCRRLMELELLQDMRLDVTLPDGRPLRVDGFLAVNEDRLLKLPDATLAELHRSGILALIHAHRISLGNLRRLAERRARKQAH